MRSSTLAWSRAAAERPHAAETDHADGVTNHFNPAAPALQNPAVRQLITVHPGLENRGGIHEEQRAAVYANSADNSSPQPTAHFSLQRWPKRVTYPSDALGGGGVGEGALSGSS